MIYRTHSNFSRLHTFEVIKSFLQQLPLLMFVKSGQIRNIDLECPPYYHYHLLVFQEWRPRLPPRAYIQQKEEPRRSLAIVDSNMKFYTQEFTRNCTHLCTPWPYLTFIVDTLVQSSQCSHQIKSNVAFRLRPSGPECRCNVRVSPTLVR